MEGVRQKGVATSTPDSGHGTRDEVATERGAQERMSTLEEIEEYLSTMSPAPWSVEAHIPDGEDVGQQGRDMIGMARLRNDAPWLIARVRELEGENERLRNQWVSVETKLPEQYASCLIAHTESRDGELIVEEAQWDGEKWCLVRTEGDSSAIWLEQQVKFWQPLPAPPAERALKGGA